MGSLVSAPKTPKSTTSQIVYVSTPTTTQTSTQDTATAQSTTSSDSTTTASDTEDTLARERVATLLQSRRGILGTILTGFRGFLDPASASPQRKTLLGE